MYYCGFIHKNMDRKICTQKYAFQTFICIPARVMQKVWKDRAVGILVTPDWPNQIWYSQLSQLIIKEVALPPKSDLLVVPTRPTEEHPLNKTMHQAALVSGE